MPYSFCDFSSIITGIMSFNILTLSYFMWHSAFCGTYFVGRLCKPPNRKKFEEDIAQCTDGIQTKEGQLVSPFFYLCSH